MLLCCARITLEGQQVTRLEAALAGGLDWDWLLGAASRHRLLPLLWWHLQGRSAAIPPEIQARLQEGFEWNARHNLRLTGELLRLLRLFEQHDIAAVPYKGPVLAQTAYGNLALRSFIDLDFLLPERQVRRARDLLIELGYEQKFPPIDTSDRFLRRFLREYHLRHYGGDHTVEVKWEVASSYFRGAFDSRRAWQRLGSIPFGNRRVLALGAEDTLIALCVHGAGHLWLSLGWLCDVAEFVRASPALDWGATLRMAREQGSLRIVLLTLWLARALLDLELNAPVLRALAADPRIAPLGERVTGLILSEPGFELTIGVRSRLQIWFRERPWDQVRYCLHFLIASFLPTQQEVRLLPLPSHLLLVYSLLRPIRLLAKYGRRLVRRGR